MGVSDKFTAIRKGLLEFLILRIVASDKVYVADMLERLSDTEFSTQEGTLYPLLSKMRREGLVDYEWQESDAGPPRKYYELTAKGKAQLAELNDYWNTMNATVSQLGRWPCRKGLRSTSVATPTPWKRPATMRSSRISTPRSASCATTRIATRSSPTSSRRSPRSAAAI